MLTKKFVKSHSVFKVKFEVRQEELPAGMNVQTIRLVGEFNGWDETAVPMSYHKKDVTTQARSLSNNFDGTFTIIKSKSYSL